MARSGFSPDKYTHEDVDLSVNRPGGEFRMDMRYIAHTTPEAIELIQEAGKAFARRVRYAIRNQIYAWPPLSPNYAAWKEANDLDPRMLIATHEYINSIKATMTDYGVEVGLDPSKTHAGGIPMRLLGRWLEYGTMNLDGSWRMPPRPHWRPEIRRWKNNTLPELRIQIKSMMMAHMQKDMRKRVATMLSVVR